MHAKPNDSIQPVVSVAELVAWLRKGWENADDGLNACPDWAEADEFADAIAEKFG